MLEFKEIINKDEWESFLLSQDETPFMQSWAWGEIESEVEEKVFRIGFYSDSVLVGIALATKVNAKRGRFLHIRQGPIMKSWDWSYFEEFSKYLRSLGKHENVDFVRIALPLLYSSDNNNMMRKLGYKVTIDGNKSGLRTLMIDLSDETSEIKSKFRKNTRYYINRAEKKGVTVQLLEAPDSDISEFLKLLNQTGKRKGFFVDKQVENEFRAFAKDGNAVVFQAMYSGKVLAAGLYLYYGNQGNSHYRGTSEEYSDLRASNLMHWKAIEYAKMKEKKVFNLWGVAPENEPKHPWAGFSSFKRGFSNNEVVFMQVHDLPISYKYNAVRFYEYLVALKRGY